MPRFAANLSSVYRENAFPDHFAAAARDGIGAVEFAFGCDSDRHDLAQRLKDHGLQQMLIEPIHPRDIPGCQLDRQDEAHAIFAEVGAPNLTVQMDLHHCQIVDGDVAIKLRRYLPTGRVGHLQIAGVPERHEPDLGELHHPDLFALIDELGYNGRIGCEYRPAAGTTAGLGWMAPDKTSAGDKP
jgi:2-dehydrotetronate isomerase